MNRHGGGINDQWVLDRVISPVSPFGDHIICYKFTFFVWINCQLCPIAFSVTLNFQFVLRVGAIKMDTRTSNGYVQSSTATL